MFRKKILDPDKEKAAKQWLEAVETEMLSEIGSEQSNVRNGAGYSMFYTTDYDVFGVLTKIKTNTDETYQITMLPDEIFQIMKKSKADSTNHPYTKAQFKIEKMMLKELRTEDNRLSQKAKDFFLTKLSQNPQRMALIRFRDNCNDYVRSHFPPDKQEEKERLKLEGNSLTWDKETIAMTKLTKPIFDIIEKAEKGKITPDQAFKQINKYVLKKQKEIEDTPQEKKSLFSFFKKTMNQPQRDFFRGIKIKDGVPSFFDLTSKNKATFT